MSLPSAWKQFQLFEFLPVRDPAYGSAAPLFSDPSLTAIVATQSYVVFAANNHLHVLARASLDPVRSFCAHGAGFAVAHMKPLPHSDLLVTLAEQQGSPAEAKIWDLHKIVHLPDGVAHDDDAMRHKFVTAVSVHDGDDSFPISCMSFNESLTCIALGYTNGKVILVRGDLLRDRGSKQRLVYEGTEPITGIQFHRFEDLLYVSTTSRIFTILSTGKNRGKPLRTLSRSAGADLDCSDIEAASSKFIVAGPEGLSFYNHNNKAQVVNFSVAKRKILRLFKDYILLVCPSEETTSMSSTSVLTRLLVLDLRNMHISFSLTIPNSAVSHVFSSNDEAFVLSTDGVLYRILEKPVNQQVELILQRELYSIALNVAKQYSLDNRTLLKINRAHAEHLYTKQDFDAAIAKYMDCLPLFPETANVYSESEVLDDFVISVITKFKEVSNIHNMTTFLARLYSLKLADADHLTLLISCYCRLKMTSELDDFIDGLDLNEDRPDTQKLDLNKLNFSLIINLFKECGNYTQVIKLLYKLNHSHSIVSIQLSDLKQYDVCLSYIKTLPVNELLSILIDYSKDLLDAMPIDTTKLLIDVFTGQYKPAPSHTLLSEDALQNEPTPPKPTVDVSSYSALLGYLAAPLMSSNGEVAPEENTEPTYLPPKPSLVYPCFIHHPKEFVVFLEACYDTFDRFQGNTTEKRQLVETLFEMYLSMSSNESAAAEEWVSKAQNFLNENLAIMDTSKALLISHIYGLEVGEPLAKESNENFEEDMFRSAELSGNYNEAKAIVQKYGEVKPLLYKLMLSFVCSSKQVFGQATKKDFRELLENVNKHKLATPMEVINMLSSNQSATIGLIKDYLIDYVGNTKREIANNSKLTESYEHESTVLSSKLAELTTRPLVLNNEECSNCKLQVDPPSVYFKCKHSYHRGCLDENVYIVGASSKSEPQCPVCINTVRDVTASRDQQLKTVFDEELFQTKMNESDDRFKVMSEYVGRGVMGTQ